MHQTCARSVIGQQVDAHGLAHHLLPGSGTARPCTAVSSACCALCADIANFEQKEAVDWLHG